MARELPEQILVSITLDGEPLEGAWVDVCLVMQSKNDYHLAFGPTNGRGALSVGRAAIERQAEIQLGIALMDYMPIGAWIGDIVLTPYNAERAERAKEAHRIFAASVPEAYPPDFFQEMDQLAKRLHASHGSQLDIAASADGTDAHLACRAISA